LSCVVAKETLNTEENSEGM